MSTAGAGISEQRLSCDSDLVGFCTDERKPAPVVFNPHWSRRLQSHHSGIEECAQEVVGAHS
jgi:hypothetical protein